MKGFGVKVAAIIAVGLALGAVNYALNPRVTEAIVGLRAQVLAERHRVSFSEALAREPLLWVDARNAAAFAKSHAPAAVHLPPESFDDRLADLFAHWEPGQTIIVYCDGAACNASAEVAARLRQAFGDAVAADGVLVLEGGWASFPADWKGGVQ